MSGMEVKYGIWGGRFQIIHNGHENVLKYVANNYSHVCIGIVNPNPQTPAWSILEHEKFDPQKNPFTYFQRAYLWNVLLKYHSINAVIVPHWHPRKSLKLESTFLPLPQKSREWVIPLLPGEEFKIEDFINAGEKVHTLNIESPDLRMIHASEIRRLFEKSDIKYKADIPEKIQLKTEDFLNKKGLDEQFIVIPLLKDNLHPLLLCAGIWLSVNMYKKIIFAPTVSVKNKAEWWKFKPKKGDYFKFYQKHEMINIIMKKLHFYDYMVIPIIVKGKKCEAIDAFLPDSNNRSWYFIKGINSSSVFSEFLSSENIEKDIDFKLIPEDIYVDVFYSIFDLYNQRNFYDKDERDGYNQMPKNDFSNMKVNSFTYNESGNVYQSTGVSTKPRLEDIISDVLKAENCSKINDLLEMADKEYKGKAQSEVETIINDVVKEHIDSNEKRSSFLEKLKSCTYSVGNSVVAGLLLQCLKNLIF